MRIPATGLSKFTDKKELNPITGGVYGAHLGTRFKVPKARPHAWGYLELCPHRGRELGFHDMYM